MRIIILGATGYLGSRVVKALLGRGHHVLCLKRDRSSLKNLENVLGQVQFCDIDGLEAFLSDDKEPYHCFMNLACRYPRDTSEDLDIYEANLTVPLKVFLSCITHKVKKIITIGTGLANDFNVYAISKWKFAELCKWHGIRSRDRGMPLQVCNVELENFYGEDEPTDRFIPGMIARLKHDEQILLTEGDQKRDIIYIGDVVRNLVWLAERSDLPEYLDLPLGTGEGIPIREIVEYLKNITGSCSELCFGAVPKRLYEEDSFADCTKMKELGMDVEYSWKAGLKKII